MGNERPGPGMPIARHEIDFAIFVRVAIVILVQAERYSDPVLLAGAPSATDIAMYAHVLTSSR